jgi:hypothetical protein
VWQGGIRKFVRHIQGHSETEGRTKTDVRVNPHSDAFIGGIHVVRPASATYSGGSLINRLGITPQIVCAHGNTKPKKISIVSPGTTKGGSMPQANMISPPGQYLLAP